jgi:L-methionine (R)-S-oxide reductase
MNIPKIKESVNVIIKSNTSVSEKLQNICNYLKQEIDYFHWVGFYFKNGDKKELKLAEFAGEPTEHIIIPFGKGICGQVAISNKNFIVPDVSAQENYISCGWKVKSEIVIPIFVQGKNIGQIDIDSHIVNPFSKDDEILLEYVCEKVSEILS